MATSSPFEADADAVGDPELLVEFRGEKFRCCRQGDGFALLRWYKLVKKTIDGTASPEEMIAQRELVYDMIVGWLIPDEHRQPTPAERAAGVTRPILVHSELQRFQDHVAPLRLSVADLLTFVWEANAAATGRPTEPPSPSRAGPSTTDGGRTSNSPRSTPSTPTKRQKAARRPAPG